MKPFNPCGARHERSRMAVAVLASLVNLPAAAEIPVSAEILIPLTANEAQTTSRQGVTEETDVSAVNLKVGRALAAGLRADLILENASDETYSTTQVVSTSPAFPALPINRPGRFATLQFS